MAEPQNPSRDLGLAQVRGIPFVTVVTRKPRQIKIILSRRRKEEKERGLKNLYLRAREVTTVTNRSLTVQSYPLTPG